MTTLNAVLIVHDITDTVNNYNDLPTTGRHREGGLNAGTPTLDEGRKPVIEIMAAILTSLHMETADDLFGVPYNGDSQASPRTDNLIAASVQWSILIMKKVDAVCGKTE